MCCSCFRALPLCGNMVPFNFLGRCFRSKKILCFLELWFLKLRFCKFRSLWTNRDPFLVSIIVEIPLFRIWETFKKYLWVVLFPVWKPSKKYRFFLDFFELYDAPLFQVSEPSAKYSSFFGGNYNFWRCAVCGQLVDSSLFPVLVRELVLVLLVAPPSRCCPPLLLKDHSK